MSTPTAPVQAPANDSAIRTPLYVAHRLFGTTNRVLAEQQTKRLKGVLQPERIQIRGVFRNRYRDSNIASAERCVRATEQLVETSYVNRDPSDGKLLMFARDRDTGKIAVADLCAGGDTSTRRTVPAAAKKFGIPERRLHCLIEQAKKAAKEAAKRAAKAAAGEKFRTPSHEIHQLRSESIYGCGLRPGSAEVRIISDQAIEEYRQNTKAQKLEPSKWLPPDAFIVILGAENENERHEIREQAKLYVKQDKLKCELAIVHRVKNIGTRYERRNGKRIATDRLEKKRVSACEHYQVRTFLELFGAAEEDVRYIVQRLKDGLSPTDVHQELKVRESAILDWRTGPKKDVEFIRDQINKGAPLTTKELLTTLEEKRGWGPRRRYRLLQLAGACPVWRDGKHYYVIKSRVRQPRDPIRQRPTQEIVDWLTKQLDAHGPLLREEILRRAADEKDEITEEQCCRAFRQAKRKGQFHSRRVPRSANNPPGVASFWMLAHQHPPSNKEALDIIAAWEVKHGQRVTMQSPPGAGSRAAPGGTFTDHEKTRQDGVNKGGRPKENAHIEEFIADKLHMKPKDLLPLCRSKFPDEAITKSRLRKIIFVMRKSPPCA